MSNIKQFTGKKTHYEYVDAQQSIVDHVREVCDGMPMVAVLGIIDLVKMELVSVQVSINNEEE